MMCAPFLWFTAHRLAQRAVLTVGGVLCRWSVDTACSCTHSFAAYLPNISRSTCSCTVGVRPATYSLHSSISARAARSTAQHSMAYSWNSLECTSQLVHLQVTCDALVYGPGGVHLAAQQQVLNNPLQEHHHSVTVSDLHPCLWACVLATSTTHPLHTLNGVATPSAVYVSLLTPLYLSCCRRTCVRVCGALLCAQPHIEGTALNHGPVHLVTNSPGLFWGERGGCVQVCISKYALRTCVCKQVGVGCNREGKGNEARRHAWGCTVGWGVPS